MTGYFFLRWHLGLGDSLICHGLVRVMRERFGSVTIPCKPHNLFSVLWQFRDDPSIHVIPADDDEADSLFKTWRGDKLALGYYGKGFDEKRWDVSFYEQACVKVKDRWDKFKVDYPDGALPTRENDWSDGIKNLVFRHEDPKRGFLISHPEFADLPTIRPSQTNTIFDWMPTMWVARRFECIDSCFAILADQMETQATEFHLYLKPRSFAPNGPPTILRKPWVLHESKTP